VMGDVERKSGSDLLRTASVRIDVYALTVDGIKRDIEETRVLARRKKDITNLNRIDENRTKIAGMITDKSEVNNRNPDKIIISYTKPSTENNNNAINSSTEIESRRV